MTNRWYDMEITKLIVVYTSLQSWGNSAGGFHPIDMKKSAGWGR